MIWAIGDTHGNFAVIEYAIRDIAPQNLNGHKFFLVHLGDFGVGFNTPDEDDRILKSIDATLARNNGELLVVRGNHDNPTFWSPSSEYTYDNISFVPDNSIRVLDGKVCLFAGGAISIDRSRRVENKTWWRDEVYTFSEIPLGNIESGIDLVFTHDVWHGIQPSYDLDAPILHHFYSRDRKLRLDLYESQLELRKLYDAIEKLNITANKRCQWFHGHYHEYRVWTWPEHPTVQCVTGLDIDQVTLVADNEQ